MDQFDQIIGDAIQDVKNFALNAWNGVLTPDQVAQIDTATQADIARAAQGNPALAQSAIEKWRKELSATVQMDGGTAKGFTLAGLFSSPGAKNVGGALLGANFGSLFLTGGVVLLGVAGFLLFERAKG